MAYFLIHLGFTIFTTLWNWMKKISLRILILPGKIIIISLVDAWRTYVHFLCKITTSLFKSLFYFNFRISSGIKRDFLSQAHIPTQLIYWLIGVWKLCIIDGFLITMKHVIEIRPKCSLFQSRCDVRQFFLRQLKWF